MCVYVVLTSYYNILCCIVLCCIVLYYFYRSFDIDYNRDDMKLTVSGSGGSGGGGGGGGSSGAISSSDSSSSNAATTTITLGYTLPLSEVNQINLWRSELLEVRLKRRLTHQVLGKCSIYVCVCVCVYV